MQEPANAQGEGKPALGGFSEGLRVALARSAARLAWLRGSEEDGRGAGRTTVEGLLVGRSGAGETFFPFEEGRPELADVGRTGGAGSENDEGVDGSAGAEEGGAGAAEGGISGSVLPTSTFADPVLDAGP